MKPCWFIDALDARGGLAFGSHRLRNAGDDRIEDYPTVYLAPPAFEPEYVSNRSPALAALRGAFQEGLWVFKGPEVGFAALPSLVEFVRRTYLAGGGGDSANGAGSGVPPYPGEGPPGEGPASGDEPTLTEDTERQTVRHGIADNVLEFVETSRKLNIGSDSPADEAQYDWSRGSGDDSGNAKDEAVLAKESATAAISVAIELLRRFPGFKYPESASRWRVSASKLGRACAELWLLNDLLASRHAKLLQRALADAALRLPPEALYDWVEFTEHLQSGDPWAIFMAIRIFFGTWPFNEFEMRGPHDLRYSYYIPNWRAHDRLLDLSADPIDDLSSWPVPIMLTRTGVPAQNLWELLTLFVGAPSRVVQLGARLDDVLSLVLFAAAHVVKSADALSRGEQATVTNSPVTSAADFWRVSAYRRGLNWLRSQMPKLVFPSPIEEMIGSTADLKYRS
jgi:hypothetical protein